MQDSGIFTAELIKNSTLTIYVNLDTYFYMNIYLYIYKFIYEVGRNGDVEKKIFHSYLKRKKKKSYHLGKKKCIF